MIDRILARATQTTDPLEPRTSLVIGAAVLVITWSPLGYTLVRHLVTLVHEAGHAMVAVLMGRRLAGIRLHSDTSGLTVSKGRPRGFGMVMTLLAGYPAPAIVGLLGALVLGAGHAGGLLWGFLVACVLMLLLVRNLYGLWVVLVTGAVLFAAMAWAPEDLFVGIAHALVWSLLLAAPRSVVELQRERRRRRTSSDADQLARLTRIPAVIWITLFWLVCVAALLLAATQLLDVWPLAEVL